MIKVLGLALYSAMAASTRHRLQQYADGLMEHGIDLQVRHLLGDDYLRARFSGSRIPWLSLLRNGVARINDISQTEEFDMAIVYGELFPLLPAAMERLLMKLPYIYDFDDAFYLKYRSGRMHLVKPFLGGKFDSVIRHAVAVTAGNHHLAGYARRFNERTVLLPTVVDTHRFKPQRTSRDSIFTVGWIGSPSTAPYLMKLVEPLSQVARDGPVKLIVIGGTAPRISGVQVEEIAWTEDNEVSLLNHFDVGVMPLPDDDWTRGKCAFKLVQYMACGVPVVASRVGANTEVVAPECGYLVDDIAGWVEAIRILRDRADIRKAMGYAARERIVSNYSLQTNIPILADIISSLALRRL